MYSKILRRDLPRRSCFAVAVAKPVCGPTIVIATSMSSVSSVDSIFAIMVLRASAKLTRETGAITCLWSQSGSSSRSRLRTVVSAGGLSSTCRYFLLRRRTDRRHPTRGRKRLHRAASRVFPKPLRCGDRPAANRSRPLPRCRATTLPRPR
jgi:hypothetical protein